MSYDPDTDCPHLWPLDEPNDEDRRAGHMHHCSLRAGHQGGCVCVCGHHRPYIDRSQESYARQLPKSPPDGWVTSRGWYNMLCFNSLDGALQKRLVYYGNIPLGSPTNGRCHNPAEVEITTVHDAMPGPRFYCLLCAIEYLVQMRRSQLDPTDTEVSRDV